MNKFDYENVLIYGYGISGCGAKKLLEKIGVRHAICNDNTFSVYGGEKFDLIVVNPAVPPSNAIFQFADEKQIPVISEIELGFLFFQGDVVAITGTNGKTTTTELIGEMFSKVRPALVAGNIGKSFAEYALDGYSDAILEVSSFQLEHIKTFRPHIACITNIASDHLDRHGSMKNYIAAKLSISKNQTQNDYLILSQDDIPIYALDDFSTCAQVLYTALNKKVAGAYTLFNRIYFFDEYICDIDRIKMRGEHNLLNALMAVCAAKLSGIANGFIIDALTSFDVDRHRNEIILSHNGKTFINDSKGTNIAATVKAVKAMTGDTVLIAGGSDKGYEYDDLFMNLTGSVKRIVTIGQTKNKIIAAAFKYHFYNIEEAADLKEAVVKAMTGPEENILLSPASASFDMFLNYKDRGDQFVKIVKELCHFEETSD